MAGCDRAESVVDARGVQTAGFGHHQEEEEEEEETRRLREEVARLTAELSAALALARSLLPPAPGEQAPTPPAGAGSAPPNRRERVRRKGSEPVNLTVACYGVEQMVEGEVALGISPEADCIAAPCSVKLNGDFASF